MELFTVERVTYNFRNILRFETEAFLNDSDITTKTWKISYGTHTSNPDPTYFIAIYPAFCILPKAVFHCTTVVSHLAALNEFIRVYNELKARSESGKHDVLFEDLLAVIFSISRNKESFELFQEQKDLLDLGLRHYCLDNYYQDYIKELCGEYYVTGKVRGVDIDIKKIIG